MTVPLEPKSNTADIFSADVPELLVRHFQQLHEGSGLSVDIIRERGARSVLGRKELKTLGFSPSQQRVPGLVLPVWSPDGGNGLHNYRPDLPRVTSDGNELKYELPVGASVRLDVPPRCRPLIGNPAIPLWITEGQKKGDALADRGLCAVALLGVWMFKGKNTFGGTTMLADFDLIALNGRDVRIVFDSDVMHKPSVRAALDRLTEHMQRRTAHVTAIYLPNGQDGQKVGVDDYLLTHTLTDLEQLVQQPAFSPKAAAQTIELLDEAPPMLSRPLALIGESAYAATWLWLRSTATESLAKDGKVVRHDPPIVETRRELYVARNDGTVFGPGERQSLDDLAPQVRLEAPPRDEKLWRPAGVKAYRSGRRPTPADVLSRVVRVFDHFVDFSRSLAGQSEMYELSACISLATWYADAYTVLPYAYPNGERGCGKTKWGTIWAGCSYLGEVVLTSGSFAALRDLADYGASLLFDDAEILADPKKSDPNKRELFLAGNRRGAMIPLKEPKPDGRGWETRWVNAYCPRAFTAIRLPDPVLASRSIIIPLTRSADVRRANADPADPKRWPCDQAQLRDDLWALALWLLPEAQRVWVEFEDEDGLAGRDFEPWRAVLAVARLLERHGAVDLEQRMRAVMTAYQREKGDLLDDGDHTVQVVRALLSLALDASDGLDRLDGADGFSEYLTFSAAQIADMLKCEEDSTDTATWEDGERGRRERHKAAARVGYILKRLRVGVDRAPTRRRDRRRVIARGDVIAIARTYGLVPLSNPSEPSEPSNPSDNHDPPEQPSGAEIWDGAEVAL